MVARTQMTQKPSQRRRLPKPIVRQGDDGIHQAIETIRRAPGSRRIGRRELEAIRAALIFAAASFDQEIAAAERKWKGARGPSRDPQWPDPEWYAQNIMALITRVRMGLMEHPNSELLIVYAVRLGALMADADWRFTQGDLVRRKMKHIQQARHASQQPRRNTKYSEHNRWFDDAIRTHRQRHPGAKQRQMAKDIALGFQKHVHETTPLDHDIKKEFENIRKHIQGRLKLMGD